VRSVPRQEVRDASEAFEQTNPTTIRNNGQLPAAQSLRSFIEKLKY
jgi:hypothetical protein